MADVSWSSKRTSSPSGDVDMNITHLPELALTHAASYLARPSRALLAVAMAAPSRSWSECAGGASRPVVVSTAGRAVLGGKIWEELDFEKVEKGLAAKLTDDNMAAILTCIDARSNLRKLKLSGCVNISGEGLGPLRASSILEHADLSLVGLHESPEIHPEPKLEEEAVYGILQSIVRLEGNSLKLLILPKLWRDTYTLAMHAFTKEYGEMLRNRNALCSRCTLPCCSHEGEQWFTSYRGQLYTCFGCARNVCDRRECNFRFCNLCQKLYCEQCTSGCYHCRKCVECLKKTVESQSKSPSDTVLTACGCGRDFCQKCYKTCLVCNRRGCWDCANISLACEYGRCSTAICEDCTERYGFDGGLTPCRECRGTYCRDCRVYQCTRDSELEPCKGCAKILSLFE